MSGTVDELQALIDSIPKRDVEADIKVALDRLDPDKERTRLQHALRNETSRSGHLAAELDAAKAKIAMLSGKVAALEIQVAEKPLPVRPVTPPPPDRSLEQVRAAEQAKQVAQAARDEFKLRAEKAEARAKDAEGRIEHAEQHARAAESAMKDAVDQAAKAHDEGYKAGQDVQKYALDAAERLFKAKNRGTVKVISENGDTTEMGWIVKKALEIEDQVRAFLEDGS